MESAIAQGKRYDMEMEFRDAIWRSGFWYDGKRKETLYSYSLCGDTIKVFESREKYIIQELTDSTLVFQYLPDTLTIGVGPVRCVTDNSPQGQWENESRLDSIWRTEMYGEVYEAKVLRSCGIQDWDNQVLEIIRKMPRWTPTINYYGKGEYRESVWTVPIFFKRNWNLIAHTAESRLEAGVPVCYLNEQDDTIVPYGKYKFCQTDTIRNIGFVYENKQNARIVCIDNQGKELFYVYKYDNGPDYIREGLFRIMDENGLIGFADSLGNVVIKPQFKFATSFENGKAQATTSGEAMNDGEHSFWKSDEWQLIDHKGDKMIKYVAIRSGTSLKGLQITILGKQREISQEISYSYPPDIEFANNLDVWVNLQDVSFDGKDDILVNLGQYGNQMIQYYDCLVWDETKGQYCKDESFRQIENPQINNEKKRVYSSSRISAASYSYKCFEFIDGHYVETASLTQTFKGSKQPPLFTEKQYVKGKGLVTLHKDVSVDKIDCDWLSIIMK